MLAEQFTVDALRRAIRKGAERLRHRVDVLDGEDGGVRVRTGLVLVVVPETGEGVDCGQYGEDDQCDGASAHDRFGLVGDSLIRGGPDPPRENREDDHRPDVEQRRRSEQVPAIRKVLALEPVLPEPLPEHAGDVHPVADDEEPDERQNPQNHGEADEPAPVVQDEVERPSGASSRCSQGTHIPSSVLFSGAIRCGRSRNS